MSLDNDLYNILWGILDLLTSGHQDISLCSELCLFLCVIQWQQDQIPAEV